MKNNVKHACAKAKRFSIHLHTIHFSIKEHRTVASFYQKIKNYYSKFIDKGKGVAMALAFIVYLQ